MSEYEETFRERPEFERRRSALKTGIWLAVAAAAVIGLVLILVNLQQFVADAEASAEDAVLVRNRFRYTFGPLLTVVGLPILAIVALFMAIARSADWHRVETGSRLRRKYWTRWIGGRPLFEELYRRFTSFDPAVYTPLRRRYQRGDVGLDIWLVPEDAIGYVGVSMGRRKTLERAGLITFKGPHYAALAASVRNGMDRPLPADKNPLTAR